MWVSILFTLVTYCFLFIFMAGLSVWPASILLGQWVARRWGTSSGVDMSQKVVLELGAGCGLPAIVAGKYAVCRTQLKSSCNFLGY